LATPQRAGHDFKVGKRSLPAEGWTPERTGRQRGQRFLGNSFFSRQVIRPRVRSYGESSTLTVSPGRMRM